MPSVTAIILTKDEGLHIARCIESLSGLAERVCIVDSGSNDETIRIAKGLGANISFNPWVNYSTQFQWALDHCDIQTDWTMRIDADEYLSPELRAEIARTLDKNVATVDGYTLRRCTVFMGKKIHHGFFYPQRMLRIWRTGLGKIEQRWMDEHIVLQSDNVERIEARDLYDENLKDLSWWLGKLDGYATREMFDILTRDPSTPETEETLHGRAKTKRLIKEKVYNRLPPAARSTLYFFYRYVLGRGFLDGRRGFIFHFIQAYFYRLLIDAKILEVQRSASLNGVTVTEEIKSRYGVDL